MKVTVFGIQVAKEGVAKGLFSEGYPQTGNIRATSDVGYACLFAEEEPARLEALGLSRMFPPEEKGYAFSVIPVEVTPRPDRGCTA